MKYNVTYVGETKRHFTRLKEHCKKHTGSVTTHCVNPEKIIGLYRLETATKKKALELEDTITEMIMQNKGKYFYKVFGGKYHVGFRPDINPVKDKEFLRDRQKMSTLRASFLRHQYTPEEVVWNEEKDIHEI